MIRQGDRLIDIDDYAVISRTDGENILRFSINAENKDYRLLSERAVLNADGQDYIITSIDMDLSVANIEAVIDHSAWEAGAIRNFTTGMPVTLENLMLQLLPDGWSLHIYNYSSKRRLVEIEGISSPYLVIQEAHKFFDFALQYDNRTEAIYIYQNPGSYINDPVMVMDGLNLDRLEYKGKAGDFFTVLYAEGAEDLTFADINDGKDYVEDFSYTAKRIIAYWKDERYTVKENLLEDARAKVYAASHPQITYTCSIKDLYAIDKEEYAELRLGLLSTVRVIDHVRKDTVDMIVSEYEDHPLNPELNVVTLSSDMEPVKGIGQTINEAVADEAEQRTTEVELAFKKMQEIVENSSGLYTTTLTDPGGASIYYLHDQESLADSTIIWRMSAEIFSVSTDGGNTWNTGLTADGNVIAQRLSVVGIDADWIRIGKIAESQLESVLQNRIDANIVSVTVQYAQNQSNTTAPATGWQDNAPLWQEGYYIWQRVKSVEADNTVTYSTALCITGVKGTDGTSVTISGIEYGVSDNGDTQPSSWQSAIPAIAAGKWLWVKTTYSDSSVTYSKSYSGTDGDDGISVMVQSVTKTGKITTVVLVDSNGNTSTLTIKDGEDGDDGTPGTNGLNGYVHIAWANSSDGSVDFSTSVSAGKSFIGTYTDNTAADSQTYSDYSWSLIKGDTGAAGSDGADGVAAITLRLYKRNAITPSKPANALTYTFADATLTGDTDGWTSYIPSGSDPCWVVECSFSGTAGDFCIIRSNTWRYPVKLVENGEDGVGITSIEEEWYLSDSDQTQSGGSWSSSQPVWIPGKYYWARSKITYDDGTIEYTAPILAEGLNTANVTANAAADAAAAATGISQAVRDKLIALCTDNNMTYIDGGVIAAATILANSIDINDLFAQNITATNFNITGGSIQITTATDTSDFIRLQYGTKYVYLCPSYLRVRDSNLNGKNTFAYLGPNGLWITQEGIYLATYYKDGIVYRDDNNTIRGNYGIDWLSFFSQSGDEVLALSANSNTAPHLRFRDSSGGKKLRMQLLKSSLVFYDTGENTLATYDTSGSIIRNGGGYILATYSGSGLIINDGSGTLKAGLSNVGQLDLKGSTYPNIRGNGTKLTANFTTNTGSGWSLTAGYFYPTVTGDLNLGASNYLWKQVFAQNATISTSDRKEKHDIRDVDDKYISLFDLLHPVQYMRNGGDRIHIGFISQDVEEALNDLEMDAEDFAGFCKDVKTSPPEFDEAGNEVKGEEPVIDEDGNPEYRYSLRYEEFIALNTAKIKMLEKQIKAMDKYIKALEDRIGTLESMIDQGKEEKPNADYTGDNT